MIDNIARFRRFARAVTSEVGALDTSFLGLGRPLGAARVLNAVGRGIEEINTIRTTLRLDSGLTSRLLRRLEDEGLIITTSDSSDGRRRTVKLTPSGQREFETYEALSNRRAERLLAHHRDLDTFMAAIDTVASALLAQAIQIQVTDPLELSAQYCLEQYYKELAVTFDGGFDVDRSRDPHPEQLRAPIGAFLVALSDGLPVGCVGLKGQGNGQAEVKRLWVSPTARGLGLSYRLMEALQNEAETLGISLLRLDTNRNLPGALHLYRSLKWCEIERYNDDPYADYFFEKRLSAA